MSIYTDSASRFGKKLGTGDDRAMFLTEFGGRVIVPYDIANDYDALRWVKNIQQGKADTFPGLGTKRDAAEHEAGELITGGTILSGEVEITLDKMVYDSVFVADVDELISHFDVMDPYAHQLGQSLGSLKSKRIAIMHIKASRWASDGNTLLPGRPTPGYAYHADMKTSASALEDAAWAAKTYLEENDVTGQEWVLKLPHQQRNLLAKNFGTTEAREAGGSGNKTTGGLGSVVGFSVSGSNNIPKTNITTGLTKYQGNFTTTVGHFSSKSAVASLERRGLRVVMKDQPERIGTIMIASEFCGHGVYLPEASFELATAARA